VRSYLDRWARQLIRRGIKSGLIEGSNLWLSVGALAWLARFLARRPAAQVSTESLRLGESVVVSHVPAPARSRRARKKAARKAAENERRQAKLTSSRRHRRAETRAESARLAEADKSARRKARRDRTRPRPSGGDDSSRADEEGDGGDIA
jgi:hypothetical protein